MKEPIPAVIQDISKDFLQHEMIRNCMRIRVEEHRHTNCHALLRSSKIQQAILVF